MTRFSLLFAAFGVVATASAASAEVYKCTLSTVSNSGFLSRTIFVDLANDRSSARVFDGLINQVYKKPLSTKVEALPGKVYRMKWEVKGIATQQKTKINARFSARLNVATKRIDVSGTLPSNLQRVNGRGACTIER